MKKLNKLLILILICIIFLSLIEVVFSNRLPDKGREVKTIEEEIITLEQENQKLGYEIAKSGSLLKIMKKAEENGFQKPRIVYLKGKAEIAFEP